MLVRRAALAVVVAAALLAFSSTQASAIVDASCIGQQTTTFSPGLTNAPQPSTAQVTNALTTCISLTDPLIASGSSGATINYPARSCIDLLDGARGVSTTFRWNTGRTSTFTYDLTVNSVEGPIVAVLSGTITAGQFRGAIGRAVVVLGADLTRCLTPAGLSAATGPYLLDVLL